ncbi:alpha/beta fold hydrolase [Streptococcus suis]|uniref:alpha/beta fold hydrolase n=1 Tax=Streptococcus suis TaxID=1307 RepID=UPI001EE87825|nr:acetylxylan esterase [Streptococcus suis]
MIENLKLEELQVYLGRNEKPSDIDEFWNSEINKLSSNPNYRLEKRNCSLQNIECYDLYFEGTNQSEVYSKFVIPKSKDKVPIIFYFHGYQGQSREWSELLKFPAAGYGVVAMDVRGQAGKSTDFGKFEGNTVKGHIVRGMKSGPEHLFYKDIFLDVYQLVEIVAKLRFVDPNRLFSLGASQGGALALVSAALNQRIGKLFAIYPFLSDYKRVLELGNNSEAYEELFRYFKFQDPFHESEDQILQTLAYIDVKNLAHMIKCPVAMIVCLEDEVCPPSTQFAIFNRINAEKYLKLVPDYGHENFFVAVNDYIFDWLLGVKFN